MTPGNAPHRVEERGLDVRLIVVGTILVGIDTRSKRVFQVNLVHGGECDIAYRICEYHSEIRSVVVTAIIRDIDRGAAAEGFELMSVRRQDISDGNGARHANFKGIWQ
eukprot:scaffold1197_cov65-Phaeocystis_antarctica.AAC.1